MTLAEQIKQFDKAKAELVKAEEAIGPLRVQVAELGQAIAAELGVSVAVAPAVADKGEPRKRAPKGENPSKILDALTQAGKPLHVPEVVEATGISYATVVATLRKMSEDGRIKDEGAGRQRVFSVA